jgi:hypothetical protein
MAPREMALREQQGQQAQSRLDLARQQEARMAKVGQLDQTIKKRELLDTIGNSAAQSAYALVSTTEEGSMERKKGTAALIHQTRERLKALGPEAGPSLEILDNTLKEMGPDALMNLEAARYGNALKAKRAATSKPKVDKITKPWYDPKTKKWYESGSRITDPVTQEVRNVAPQSDPGAEDVSELPTVRADRAKKEFSADIKQANALRDEISADAIAADQSNRTIAQMDALMDTGFRTGPGANLGASLQAIAGFLGMPAEGEHMQNAAAFESMAMNFVQQRIAGTKGAVSDKEMELFIRSVPTLSTTPEGIDLILEGMKLLNRPALDRRDASIRLQGTRPGDYVDGIERFDAERGNYQKEKDAYFKAIKKIKESPKSTQFTISDMFGYTPQPTDKKLDNLSSKALQLLDSIQEIPD